MCSYFGISPDGRYLASGSQQGVIQLWDLNTKETIYTLSENNPIYSLAIRPDGQTFASASSDNTVKIWQLMTGRLLQTLSASSPLAFSNNGQHLVTANKHHQLEIWQQLSVGSQLIDEELSSQAWWTILGIDCNANSTAIKKAYYDLARLYHPDLNNSDNSATMMRIINQAYNKARSKQAVS